MADAPSYKTLTDIVQFGIDFSCERNIVVVNLERSIARFERYIYIPTVTQATPPEGGWTPENPDPGPTTTYAWHPNAMALYSDAERATLLAYYTQLVDTHAYFSGTVTDANTATLFDPKPKLDTLLAATLGHVISG